MSREIKFRAWTHEEGFIEVHQLDFLEQLRILTRVDGHHGVYRGTYDFELLQYTGLKDKNGVEIYEGDIVQASHRSQRDDEINLLQEQVRFLNGCFMFGNWNAHEYFSSHRYIEVIGNIYENPELLKE